MPDTPSAILAELRAWLRERRELDQAVLEAMGFPVDRILSETFQATQPPNHRTEPEKTTQNP